MIDGKVSVPRPKNDAVCEYQPGSPQRFALRNKIAELRGQQVEIPIVIGEREITTNTQFDVACPHDHGHVLARAHAAEPKHVALAIDAARDAAATWSRMSWRARLAIFLRAAELLANKHRPLLNAATMLGQSKTAHQAEIDAACELIDFLRFNAHFADRLMAQQPASAAGTWNYLDYRPLEGFVLAITPFNFTSISGNLPTAPALLGNVVLWKPSRDATYSAYFFFKLLQEAGLPPGVISFLPGPGASICAPAVEHRELAGVHFTGSTATFQQIWRTIGARIAEYRSYPRIVGETGGKDFIVAHPSADADALMTAIVRGAFEYQGQKCSAASRAFLPRSLYARIKDRLVAEVDDIAVGDPAEFENFMGAVINRRAYDKIAGYIEFAGACADATIVAGGSCDDSHGYFVRPTVIEVTNPDIKLMREEIFGPVLTCYIYPDNAFEQALELCDKGSPYALTGSVFSRDRTAIERSLDRLRNAAGNFYINDKPTGAVVNQQPFGGGRASGTNDKAGSINNLLRWVTPRTVKETFVPPTNYRYPFMASGD